MSNQNRSFFGPILFIGIGTLLLLNNMGIVDELYWVNLARLWPVFLISLGIRVMFNNQAPWIHGVFATLTALFLVGMILVEPPESWKISEQNTIHESFIESLDDVKSAMLTMDIDSSNIVIDSLSSLENLSEIDINHTGEIEYYSDGNSVKEIFVSLDQENWTFFNPLNWVGDDRLVSSVMLSPETPFSIEIDLGSGTADLDLDELIIEELFSNSGSGTISVSLPGGDFPVSLNAGSGIINVIVPERNLLDLEAGVGSGRINITLEDFSTGLIDLDSGSGSIVVNIPEGLAVEIFGDGNGSIKVPNDYLHSGGNSNNPVSMEGRWFSPEFDDDNAYLTIVFDIGSGSFRIIEN